MTYRPTKEPETWRTLKQIRSELPEGHWAYSRVYEDINVAISTGHAHDFWELPETVQANLIARFRVRGTIEAYEDEIQKEKSEQRSKQNRVKPRGRGAR